MSPHCTGELISRAVNQMARCQARPVCTSGADEQLHSRPKPFARGQLVPSHLLKPVRLFFNKSTALPRLTLGEMLATDYQQNPSHTTTRRPRRRGPFFS